MIKLGIKITGVKAHVEWEEEDIKQKEVAVLIYELEKIKQEFLKKDFIGDGQSNNEVKNE